MTWCVPFRAVAPEAEKCFRLSHPAKSSTDPMVAEGRATWVRFFTRRPGHFTRSAVLTPEMDVDVNAGIHRCGYQMWMWVSVSLRRGLRTLEVRVVLVSKVDRRGGLEAFREALLEICGGSFDVIEGR